MGYKGKSINASKYSIQKPIVIDLHGFRVSEAIELVHDRLGASDAGAIYHIIVGKGSIRGVSVLGPAIKEYLYDHGYAWRPARLADGGEGVIVVMC